MRQIGQLVVPAKDEASRLTRLHALALPAMRDREGVPVSFEKEIDQDLPTRLYGGWIPDFRHRALVRKMTLGEHGAVESRAAALELALEPQGVLLLEENDPRRLRLEAAVGAMLGGFRAMRQQGDDVAATVTVTLGVLGPYPAWAIERACMKIARSDAGLDNRYAPNDGQIADIVKEILRPYRSAFEQAAGLLSAPLRDDVPPVPNEQRPTFGELQERCAKSGVYIGGYRPKGASAKDVDDLLKKYGVSREQWDAIPNVGDDVAQ